MSSLLSALLAWFAIGSPMRAPLPEAVPNGNQHPAGRWSHDTLFVTLEARRALWRPDEGDSPPADVQAFAEANSAPTAPGPLLRVREGSVIVATVRNSLADSTLILRGLHTHPSAANDSLVVAPGGERTITFRAGARGTYAYWATTSHVPEDGDRRGPDAMLGGAFVVDPATGSVASDRIFVINQIDFDSDGTRPPPNYERFQLAINGHAWPHTERLTYGVGDSVRMRVVNLGFETHPMHLHGFFFRVESRGTPLADTLYAPDQRRLAVTEAIAPGNTFTMTWVPERAGNWLLHCHLFAHVEPDLLYPFPGDTIVYHYPSPTGKPPMAMSGLIVGITITPRPGAPARDEAAPARTVRMEMRELPFRVDSSPAISIVIDDTGFAHTRHPHDLAVPTLVLTRGVATRIWLVNQMTTPATIHWHGLELESYYDGVAGFSGANKHLAPMVMPGDSFAVRITPPRAGTFIYHGHVENGHHLASGLYGALIVADSGVPYDSTKNIILLFGGSDLNRGEWPWVNGSHDLPPRALKVGVAYRVRVIDIMENFQVHAALTFRAKPAEWTAIGKDGADLPASQRVRGPAIISTQVGETYDYEFTPKAPGDYYLEFVRPTGVVARQLWRVSKP
jgi:FtsP/CotA-like multicopper oxidase with cupredoxin domain